MQWSPQQDKALCAVRDWMADPHSPQVFRLFGYAGTGKAQPLDAVVMCPTGPRCMGDIAKGDLVLGADGKPTKVLEVYPQGIKPMFKVRFRDGSETRCCEDHLWTVVGQKSSKTISLKEMINLGIKWKSGDRRWKVPLAGAAEFSNKSAVFPPYSIGALIGDGCLHLNCVDLANPESEIAERVKKELVGFDVRTRDNGSCLHHIIADKKNVHWNRLKAHLQSMGLDCKSKDKFIPQDYLLAPIEDRIDLLRGLMDTDGSCCANRTMFATSSARLAKDVVFLVCSLGGTAIEHVYEREGVAEYQVNVKTLFCPFYLSRKAGAWKPSWKNPPSKYIDSISYVGEAEQQCISVSAADGLYLTDDFIVTHNTTLAQSFASDISGDVLYGAFTGKASEVLRSKGCTNASTIHSMIYELLDGKSDQPEFVLNYDSPVKDAELVIIDECSMVGEEIGQDLLSFGTKVLVLGDPAQLPPVQGAGFFTDHEPDFMLTEIHRQAAENPIIRLSMDIREGNGTPNGNMGSDVLVSDRKKVDLDIVQRADQFLCGKNATRSRYNGDLKKAYGFGAGLPVAGDRLVCLRNNAKNGLFNGSIWHVERVKKHGSTLKLTILSDDKSRRVKTTARVECFEGELRDLEWRDRAGHDEFDYGYALTVHKSQGSQWDKVCIYNESFCFRDDATRWLYTAVTRAADKLILYK